MNDPWAEIKALRYPPDTRSRVQKVQDWGEENPTARAVAGFVPGVGQVLDVADLANPNLDWKSRLGAAASVTPVGKVMDLVKALRGAKALRRFDEEDLSPEELQKSMDAYWEAKKNPVGGFEEAEDLADKEVIRMIRKSAIPTGLGILGTAAGAKYLEGREDE